MRTITTAYDAYWFIHDHPEFQVEERTNKESGDFEIEEGRTRKYQDKNGHWYLCYPDMGNAISTNLNIWYAKVNDERRVDDDKTKNVNVEVWLEFGQVIWANMGEFDDGREFKNHCHDMDLDCGAPTFDEALVILANKVMAKFGDY